MTQKSSGSTMNAQIGGIRKASMNTRSMTCQRTPLPVAAAALAHATCHLSGRSSIELQTGYGSWSKPFGERAALNGYRRLTEWRERSDLAARRRFASPVGPV